MGFDGVILAAGLSTRAGTYKMTLEIEGKTIIERCVEAMYDTCTRIVVVGGHKYEIISDVLSKYSKVKVIFNSNYKEGMFSSVKEGVKHVREERFFIIPGDYPLVNGTTYSMMATAEGDIIIPVYNDRKGHPILIKSYLIGDLINNPQYSNLREFISLRGFSTVRTQDAGILADIDTMNDYRNILASLLPCNHRSEAEPHQL